MQDPNCVLVVRNGRSEWHCQDQFVGQVDVPLSVEGNADVDSIIGRIS